MEPVRIGLVGYGSRGSSVAEALAGTPAVDPVAICDLDPDRRAAAREARDADVVDAYDDLLGDDGIEAVAVMTGPAGHAPLSTAALEAGKHVLCAKPLAATVGAGAGMVETANRAGLVAAVGFQKRFRPGIWTLRGAAADFDPIQATFTNQRGIYRERFLEPGYTNGLLDGLSHWIDIANWTVDRRPVAASATVRYGTFTPAEAIDAVTLGIEYTDDRTATLIGSMGGVGLEPTRQVVGTDGNARIAGDEVVVTALSFSEEHGEEKDRQRATEERLVTEAPGEGSPTRALVESFAARIREEGGEGLPTFRDGFQALGIAKAAVRSHERGGIVHLDDVAPELPPT